MSDSSIRLFSAFLLSAMLIACKEEVMVPTTQAVEYDILSKDDFSFATRSRLNFRIVALSANSEDERAQTALKAAVDLQKRYSVDAVSIFLEIDPILSGHGYVLAAADYAPDGMGWDGAGELKHGVWEASVTGYKIPSKTLELADQWYANRDRYQVSDGLGGQKTDEDALKKHIAALEHIKVSEVDLMPLMTVITSRHDYH